MKTAEEVRGLCSHDHDWGTAKVCVPCLRSALADAFRAGESAMRERAAVFASAAAESDMLGEQIRLLPLSTEVPKEGEDRRPPPTAVPPGGKSKHDAS